MIESLTVRTCSTNLSCNIRHRLVYITDPLIGKSSAAFKKNKLYKICFYLQPNNTLRWNKLYFQFLASRSTWRQHSSPGITHLLPPTIELTILTSHREDMWSHDGQGRIKCAFWLGGWLNLSLSGCERIRPELAANPQGYTGGKSWAWPWPLTAKRSITSCIVFESALK